MSDDLYETHDTAGDGWRMMLGDTCERIMELPESSVDLSIYSPPFASLFTYSPSLRDLGNCKTRDEFIEHYGFVARSSPRTT